MNATELALKLIQNYNTEHNKYRRACRHVRELQTDKQWYENAAAAGIANFYFKNTFLSHKKALNTFLIRASNIPTYALFVSAGVKSARIRSLTNKLKQLELTAGVKLQSPTGEDFYSKTHSSHIKDLQEDLERAKKAPVNAALGKMWRQIILEHIAVDKAYETRWQARCAIYAFNKMNARIQIKFGSYGRGEGSMSYINHVVVDGDKIKLARFLDNAIFETAILNG